MPTNKTQFVRLLDVFVFGPLMIAAAREQKSAYFSHALTLVGIGTIVYNGVNYLQNQQSDQLGCISPNCHCGRSPTRPGN